MKTENIEALIELRNALIDIAADIDSLSERIDVTEAARLLQATPIEKSVEHIEAIIGRFIEPENLD